MRLRYCWRASRLHLNVLSYCSQTQARTMVIAQSLIHAYLLSITVAAYYLKVWERGRNRPRVFKISMSRNAADLDAR